MKYRYTENINVIDGIDPYVIGSEEVDCNTENFPAVVPYLGIANYQEFCCYVK